MRCVLVWAALCVTSVPSFAADNARLPDFGTPAGASEPAPIDEVVALIPQDERAPVVFTRQEICDAVAAAAEAYDLPVGFLMRLIWQESGFNTLIVSRAGAQGIAQFMPETAAEMGIGDPFDPTQALPASARFLHELHRQFGNHGLAAAAYNAGAGRVRSWLAKRTKLPNETRNYVFNITGKKPEEWVGAKQNSASFVIPQGTKCQQAATVQAARWTRHNTRPRVIRVRTETVATPEVAPSRPDVY